MNSEAVRTAVSTGSRPSASTVALGRRRCRVQETVAERTVATELQRLREIERAFLEMQTSTQQKQIGPCDSKSNGVQSDPAQAVVQPGAANTGRESRRNDIAILRASRRR